MACSGLEACWVLEGGGLMVKFKDFCYIINTVDHDLGSRFLVVDELVGGGVDQHLLDDWLLLAGLA